MSLCIILRIHPYEHLHEHLYEHLYEHLHEHLYEHQYENLTNTLTNTNTIYEIAAPRVTKAKRHCRSSVSGGAEPQSSSKHPSELIKPK